MKLVGGRSVRYGVYARDVIAVMNKMVFSLASFVMVHQHGHHAIVI